MNEAERCRHFTGIQNDHCKAGVEYTTVRDASVRPYAWPCLRDSCATTCAKKSVKTPAELEDDRKEWERTFAAIATMRAAIVASGKPSGTRTCVLCGKADALRFSRASINGHIHAACVNHCVSWME